MKTTLTISLALLFLLQSFTRTFIIVNYEVNKNYIANVLCENKAKKEMHCNGKCHLKKELDKEEKSESTPTGSSKEKIEITLYNTIQEEKIVFDEIKVKPFFTYTPAFSIKVIVPVFHPPGFSA